MKKTAEELDLFVKKKLRGGYPAGELRNELLAADYSAEEIETAFYHSISSSKKTGKQSAGDYSLWLFLSVGLLILGIAINVKGLWLETWSIPLMIAGVLGIIAWSIIPLLKKRRS